MKKKTFFKQLFVITILIIVGYFFGTSLGEKIIEQQNSKELVSEQETIVTQEHIEDAIVDEIGEDCIMIDNTTNTSIDTSIETFDELDTGIMLEGE